MKSNPKGRLVTVHEAATQLSVSPDTVKRWAKKGLIRCSRNENNHRVFDIDELSLAHDKLVNGVSEPFRILQDKRLSRHRVIELFSGCGGMALGFENAGLRSTLLAEWDKNACATLRKNWPKKEIIEGDVSEIDFKPHAGEVDLVAGGFPCQAFSYAGNGRGFEDTRGTLFFEFARCLREVRPKVALGENVKGLLRHENGRTLKTMIEVLDELEYRVLVRVLRSQFHDVPQKRERLIIMAVRKDLDFPILFPREKNYIVSLREALRDVPPSPGQAYPPKKHKVMKMVGEGKYWRDLPEKIQREYMGASFHLTGGKTGMARRMAWDEPSLTLTCSPAQKQTERCHPSETRPFTVREYARIQTFPDSWEFEGSVASQYKQIGNAVPVNLAYHLGKAVRRMLEGKGANKDFDAPENSPD